MIARIISSSQAARGNAEVNKGSDKLRIEREADTRDGREPRPEAQRTKHHDAEDSIGIDAPYAIEPQTDGAAGQHAEAESERNGMADKGRDRRDAERNPIRTHDPQSNDVITDQRRIRKRCKASCERHMREGERRDRMANLRPRNIFEILIEYGRGIRKGRKRHDRSDNGPIDTFEQAPAGCRWLQDLVLLLRHLDFAVREYALISAGASAASGAVKVRHW